MEREEIIKELLVLPDTIKELHTRIIQIQRKLRPLDYDRHEIAYKHFTDVNETKDSMGKLLYSNEERRQYELGHRLRTDSKAMELDTKIRQYRDQIDDIAEELNRLQDRRLVLMVLLGVPPPEDMVAKIENQKYPLL